MSPSILVDSNSASPGKKPPKSPEELFDSFNYLLVLRGWEVFFLSFPFYFLFSSYSCLLLHFPVTYTKF